MPNLSFKPQYETCACNHCGGLDFKILSNKDRYGFEVKTVICKKCGLIFINPRLTSDSYKEFYQTSYRQILLEYKNKKEKKWDLEKNFNSARKLGSTLAKSLVDHLKPGILIEVGSSTGGILSGIKSEIPNLEVVGIEPSKEESGFANSQGVKTIAKMAEDIEEDFLSADNIMIVRSLNHLLDPGKFFAWSYKNLKDNGKLIVVVLDFLNICKEKGKLLTQIDHPFMFSAQTLRNYAEANGFKIISDFSEKDSDYIRLVAQKLTNPSEHKGKDENAFHESVKKLNPFKLKLDYLARRIASKI